MSISSCRLFILMLLYKISYLKLFYLVAAYFGLCPKCIGAKYLVHFVPVFLSNNVTVCQQLTASKQFHLHV